MKITTIAYGIAIMIFSALIHYVVQAGVANCNSVEGIVTSYASQDYATGCHILLIIQFSSIVTGLVGAGIVVWGIIRKQKMN